MNLKISPSREQYIRFLVVSLIILIQFSACAGPQVQQADYNVFIHDSGSTLEISVSAGSTVRDVIESADIQFSALDRSEPPLYTLASEGMEINLIRVTEEFWIEESVIPYKTKIYRDDTIPESEQRLLQPGSNGLQETTYRRVFENGELVTEGVVKIVTVNEAVDEIIRVGSQSPLEIFNISGKIAYISGGNAWLMEINTGNRRPILSDANLDGWVFEISPDGKWLLYSQTDDSDENINSLWAVSLDEEREPIQLNIENVIHFAAWVPGEDYGILYSTVEKSLAAPGWQAFNNLIFRRFDDEDERVSPPILLIEENTSGLYSWWGDDFRISPDGELVMVIKPDGIQIYDIGDASLENAISFSPFQTTGDWAWIPDVSWNTQSDSIFYSALKNETELSGNPESSNFEIKFFDLDSQTKLTVIQSVGIFGSPEVSPGYFNVDGELQTYLAYMQALQSSDSVTSEYRLNLVDIDGSNQRSLFPGIGLPGLDPQAFEWSPGTEPQIALLYHGNIWIIDVLSGEAFQLTADGLTSRIDWK